MSQIVKFRVRCRHFGLSVFLIMLKWNVVGEQKKRSFVQNHKNRCFRILNVFFQWFHYPRHRTALGSGWWWLVVEKAHREHPAQHIGPKPQGLTCGGQQGDFGGSLGMGREGGLGRGSGGPPAAGWVGSWGHLTMGGPKWVALGFTWGGPSGELGGPHLGQAGGLGELTWTRQRVGLRRQWTDGLSWSFVVCFVAANRTFLAIGLLHQRLIWTSVNFLCYFSRLQTLIIEHLEVSHSLHRVDIYYINPELDLVLTIFRMQRGWVADYIGSRFCHLWSKNKQECFRDQMAQCTEYLWNHFE